jgi:predicted kinase
MAVPFLVIITGHPASGKTTLARRLASDLQLPCLTKDDIKERLFDTLGWSDRAWSKKLGSSTYELIYLFSEVQLSVGRSFLLEFNFDSKSVTPRFLEIKRKFDFYPIQIVLEANAEILIQRFMERARSGARHPGNTDTTVEDEYRERLAQGPYQALDIGGSVLHIDTNDFAIVNYGEILNFIEMEMKQ